MMKRFKIYLLLLVAAFCCLLASCTQGDNKLAPPQNLRVSGTILVWDGVENATGYLIRCNMEEYEAEENWYNLSFLTDPNTYEIEVYAVADGESFETSDKATFSYVVKSDEESSDETLNLPPTKNLEYTLLKDGSGYAVSKGNAVLSGTLVIPEEYEGLPVKKIDGFSTPSMSGNSLSGYKNNTSLTRIVLPKTIETIGSAFVNFKALTEIDIPESVTFIDGGAFLGSGLRKVTLHEGLIKIGSSAFSGCTALSEIDFPDTVQSVGHRVLAETAWRERQTEDFVINNGILLEYAGTSANVTNIPSEVRLIAARAFPKELISVTIPDGVALSDEAFYSFSSLKTVVLPNDLKRLPYCTFRLCKSLENIILPEGLTEVGASAFEECTSLTKIEFPSALEKIGPQAFRSSGLTSVTIPQNVTLSSGVFSQCKALSTVVINGTKNIPNFAFGSCPTLSSVFFSEGTVSIGERAFSSCTALSKVELPSSLKSIGERAFISCPALSELELPSSLETIGASAFGGCSALTEITLPDNIKTVAYAFSGSGLKKVVLPSALETVWAGAFGGSALTEIELPQSLKTIEDSAFSGTDLTSVTFPEGLKTIGKNAFKNCSALKEFNYPSSLESIGEGAFFNCGFTRLTIPKDAPLTDDSVDVFKECVSLKSVTFLGITKLPKGIFYGCTALESVILPEGLTEIGADAFRKCSALTEITLPDTLQTIGNCAFLYTGLTSVVIPDSVTSINDPFTGCKSLKEVVLPVALAENIAQLGYKVVFEKIYYRGSEAEWNEKVPDSYVLPEETTVCFYVENEADLPADGGNYWHYVDGKPTLWNQTEE